MKKQGYQVIGRQPVCIDFADGRTVSFRPGKRFEAHPTNKSVVRAMRGNSLRQLAANERGTEPVTLGMDPHRASTIGYRNQLAQNKVAAAAKAKEGVHRATPKPAPKKSKPSVNPDSFGGPKPTDND